MDGPSTSLINGINETNGINRLLAELDEGRTGPLVEAIELGDLEQMQYWYLLLSEVSVDELLDAVERKSLSVEDIYGIFRAVHLLMQWEHNQTNELKEIIEREVVSAAEQEQKWENERKELQNELSSLNEQHYPKSSSLTFNNLNEAFRNEIDALTEENIQLKRKAQEFEKESVEQRERANNLDVKTSNIEREKILLANNQIQLEENIRELHRRLNTKSESIQKDQQWEHSKLRQRDEQALILSEQVRELASQNDELRSEANNLSQALEQATELVKENSIRFAEFYEQLAEAEHQIDTLGKDNKELRELLKNKEMESKNKVNEAEIDNRQLAELLQSKDALIEQLRNQIQNQKLEIEKLNLLKNITTTESNDDIYQKELELDNLRKELIEATETAKKLFGSTIENIEKDEILLNDTTTYADLRVRLVQMDQELVKSEKKYLEEQRHHLELEKLLEQKELEFIRLIADCQRYRRIAFGDKDFEIKKIERQLIFRDKQIQKLRKKCSELHLEVEKLNEKLIKKEEFSILEKEDKNEKINFLEENKEEKINELLENIEKEENNEINKIKQKEEKEEEEYAEEWIEEENEKEFINNKNDFKDFEIIPRQKIKIKRLNRDKIIEEATTITELNTELGIIIEEIEEKKKELNNLKKLYEERGLNLIKVKKSEENIRKELLSLKEILIFGNYNNTEECKEPLKTLDNLENEKNNYIFDNIHKYENLEALEIENMELKRFIENLEQTGNEKERRMTEETRRLVYLAIREGKLERRVKIGSRLRQAMCEELCQMRSRLCRLLTGEESRSRQLTLENEAKLFELARLQNALLHSVPLNEYNRLLKEHKQILRERFLASSPDIGYYSETNSTQKNVSEDEEELLEYNKLNNSINITRAGLLFGDNNGTNINELLLKIKKLEDINDILTGQNNSLKSDKKKTEAELIEMNAFLDDLEAETELKSMLANIERRFLHAIREQFDATEERESLQNELKRMERKFSESSREWLNERQSLVQLLSRMYSVLQKLHRERIIQNVPISTSQLEALVNKLRKIGDREMELERKENYNKEKEIALEQEENLKNAKITAFETMMENNWQLEQINQSLQGYQLNVLSLSAELQRTKRKLENAEHNILLQSKENEELKKELDEFQFILGIDINKLEQNISNLKEVEKEKKEININKLKDNNEQLISLNNQALPSSQEQNNFYIDPLDDLKNEKRHVIHINNTIEWEGQLKQYKEQALLCINSFKEQLDAKDKTLQQYIALVEQLKTDTTNQLKPKEITPESTESLTKLKTQNIPLKTSRDLLIEESRTEQWERQVRLLEGRLRLLESENSELEIEKKGLAEILNNQRNAFKNRQNVQTQVNLPIGKNKPKITKEIKQENLKKIEDQSEKEIKSLSISSKSSISQQYSDNEEENQEEDTKRESQTEGELSGTKSSDSGTVDDIGQTKRKSVLSEKLSQSKSSAGEGTRTISNRNEIKKPDDFENLILKHRNETRRLRMKLIELERRNKELSEQYNSLRERSRISVRPLRSVDPNSLEVTLRKENERLLKQNSTLNKSIEILKTESEQLKERLRRSEIHSKAGAELWELRKKHEQAIANSSKRLAETESRERELKEKLDRRERHIEQMGRIQNDKLADNDKLNNALKQWRVEREELIKKATRAEEERQALNTRFLDSIRRLEVLAKENKKLQKIIYNFKQNEMTISEPPQSQIEEKKQEIIETKEVNTQTDELSSSYFSNLIPSFSFPLPPRSVHSTATSTILDSDRGELIIPLEIRKSQLLETNSRSLSKIIEFEERERSLKSENRSLKRELKKAELYQKEATEQLDFLKKTHSQLLEDYNNLFKIEKVSEITKKSLKENYETFGIALLRDKLSARERELELIKRRMLELERQIWHSEIEK